MKPGDPVVVHKLDDRGVEVWSYPGAVVHTTPVSVTLEASYNGPDVDFHGLPLRRGDRFVETFYADRNYNIFAVHGPDGVPFKGWYCNIARPAVWREGHVSAEDLALDLVVLPDGTSAVVDQEEFEALTLSEAERAAAVDTVRKLEQMARERTGPFHQRLTVDGSL